MEEESKGNSTTAENYADQIIEVIRENEKFLRKNAKGSFDEVIEFIIEAIDYFSRAVKRERSEEDYLKSAMVFFFYHILMPLSYAIHTDLLIGNLPACFMELRLILESLSKCYIADLRYPDRNFFQEKVELLEKEMQRGKISTSKLIKNFGEELELRKCSIALWDKISRDWVHTKGIIDRIAYQIIEKGEVPPWPLVIPTNYVEADLDTIEELGKRISQFRNLLRATIEKYQQN